VLWYLTETKIFWKYHVFPARITRKKHFSRPVALKGAIFRSATTVPRLKVLYVCPVLRSNLVLCLFHSDDTAVFLFLLLGFLFSFSVIKSNYVFNSPQTRWHYQMKNSCYQKCLSKNHHLMNNSGRRQSHQCQMVIRSLVNLLKTNTSNQSVPPCKHFPPPL
jgi:hypothetical protein